MYETAKTKSCECLTAGGALARLWDARNEFCVCLIWFHASLRCFLSPGVIMNQVNLECTFLFVFLQQRKHQQNFTTTTNATRRGFLCIFHYSWSAEKNSNHPFKVSCKSHCLCWRWRVTQDIGCVLTTGSTNCITIKNKTISLGLFFIQSDGSGI